MKVSVLSVVAALLAAAAAAPSSPHVLHEKRDAPPTKWVKRSAVKQDFVLPMRIGMMQSNIDDAYELLMEVSHPDSPKYGQHYTADEVHDLFAPAKETVDAIREWLVAAGVEAKYIKQSINKQWMQVDIPAKKASELFKTTYHYFEHKESGDHTVACDEYHIPYDLIEHIDYVSPGVHLVAGGKKRAPGSQLQKRAGKKFPPGLPPVPLPGGVTALEAAIEGGLLNVCDTLITPPCIATMYNITNGTLAAKGNELGIFEDTDFYDAPSLLEYLTLLAPGIPPTTAPILHGIDGGTAPLVDTGGESDLDFQISYPIIYPQNSILFQTDDIHYELDYTFTGLFNNFLSAIDGSYCYSDPTLDPQYPDKTPVTGYNHKLQCGVYKPTNVISVSYGEQEPDLPMAYQKRQCNEFMKLGLRGTSIVFASGDSGVAARGADDGNSDGCLGANGTIFSPDFPATCPYLTTAGATYLPPGGNVSTDSEVAVTSFPSGGGFSNIYPRPAYQRKAVRTFFQNADLTYPYYQTKNNVSFGANGGIYNRAGRGYPDVSAIGDNVVIFMDGAPNLVGGTSAAAPVFASILNRINEERLAAKKKTIGFVNPVLYQNPGMFNDITVGNNSGCGTSGFPAIKGWDPVTGLGTPNFPEMLKVFMALP